MTELATTDRVTVVVRNATDRDRLFEEPARNQTVFRLDTYAFELWDGSAWTEVVPGGLPVDLIWSGAGSPEGVVTAAVGSTYQQTDGTYGKTLWIKRTGSGNTGWALMATSVGVLNAKDYGAVGDGVTNDTAAIQAAITEAGSTINRRTVFIPSGVYKVSQLVLKNGVRLLGAGIGGFGEVDSGGQYGTELQQIAGTEDDLIIFVGNSFGGTTYIGPQQISDMLLMGDPTATLGSGIKFRSAAQNGTIQDTVTLRNLLIRGFAEDGISFPGGAVPLHVQDVNLLYNGRYGINYVHSNTQAVHFDNVSGDGNLSGLIRVSNVTDYGSMLFTNIKSEKRINPDYGNVDGQENAIILNNCSGPVAIHGLTHVSSIPDGGNFEVPGAGILIEGAAAPQLSFSAVVVRVRPGDTGTSYTLQDTTNSKTIPTTVHHGFYGAAGTLQQRLVLGTSQEVFGLTVYPRGPGDPEQQISGVTPMRTWFETDAATDEKGWAIAASGGIFSERTMKDDGTTGTSYRTVTRTGSTPVKVTYAVPIAVQSTNAQMYSGSGSPEGSVTAVVGSIYMRTGGGRGTSFYVKENGSGNTGWVAIGSANQSAITNITNANSPYTATQNVNRTIFADASGGAITINLPSATTAALGDGLVFVIVKTDSSANTVTVDGNSTQTINGALTKVLTGQYEKITIQSDGSNWFVVGS